MGRKTKRQYNIAKKADRTNSLKEDEEEHVMTDSEWHEIQKNIKKQILDDDLTWEAIIEYEKLEDEWYWDSFNKPHIYDFVSKYKEYYYSSSSDNKNKDTITVDDDDDDDWSTI